ncbi:MAG: DUF2927 domain-containing protein [Pseudomonadota bacterium]
MSFASSRVFAALIATALAACAPTPEPGSLYRPSDTAAVRPPGALPDLPGYGSKAGRQEIPWTRRSIAGDFVEITFFAEWGTRLSAQLRWRRPVRVAAIGDALAPYQPRIDSLVARIDAAAPGLDISTASRAEEAEAEIVLRLAPRGAMREVAPTALCFLTPFRGDWPAYRAAAARGEARWADQTVLEAVTIFIPDNLAPNEARSCIEEEIVQSLGPVNDLYRIEDSIFNDDNVHQSATAFDLMIVRVLYDPAMRDAETIDEARRAAERALADVPLSLLSGDRTRVRREAHDDRYTDNFKRYQEADGAQETKKWAQRLSQTVEAFGPEDHRRGEAARALGFAALLGDRPGDAIRELRRAERFFAARIGPDSLRRATVCLSLGRTLFSEWRYEEALEELGAAIPVLAAHEREADLAQALRFSAVALAREGKPEAATQKAREAIAWAEYAFGVDAPAVKQWRGEFKKNDVNF